MTVVHPSLAYLCFSLSCCCYDDLGFCLYLNLCKWRCKLDTVYQFLTCSL